MKGKILLVVAVCLAVFVLMVTWWRANPRDPLWRTLADLRAAPVPILRSLSVVAQVQASRQRGETPLGRILHIRDLHLNPPDGIAEDVYAGHLQQVELCQAEQMALLRVLMAEHGVKAVWVEGLTSENRDTTLAKLVPFQGKPTQLPTPPQLLNAGAAVRLWVANSGLTPLPLEDAVAYQAAGMNGGKDRKGNRQREEALVKRIVARGEALAVIVLGANHDLAAVAAQIAPGWEVVRVTTNTVKEALGE